MFETQLFQVSWYMAENLFTQAVSLTILALLVLQPFASLLKVKGHDVCTKAVNLFLE